MDHLESRSTSHALSLARRLREVAKQQGSKFIIAFLDWEKAFEKVAATDLRSRLTKELEELREEHFGFASLRDKCLEFKSSEYTYKLCFFKDAKQSFTRLGNWDGFTSPTEAVFKNGEMCFGGPARSLKVSFHVTLHRKWYLLMNLPDAITLRWCVIPGLA
eukprot:g759.t1